MKVVLTAKTVYPFHLIGGTERFYYNLARFLAREGVDVEVVSSGLSDSLKTVSKGAVKFTFVPPRIVGRKPARVFCKLLDINITRYLLKKHDYDIIHGGIGVYTYSKFKRKPLVLQVLELWDPPCCEHWNPLIRAYMYFLDYADTRIAFRVADKVAVEIETEAREVCRLYKVSPEKIIYVPPGVDVEYMDEVVRTTNLTREDLGLSDSDLVMLCVSRLEPNKGVHILVRAFSIVAKQIEAKLILVGAGSLESLIYGMIKALDLEGKVIHLKSVPDKILFKLYEICDIVVIPTLHEGLPTVLIEAMAMGKPVVASSTPEISCVVRNLVNGVLVPPGDVKALAEAILQVQDKSLLRALGSRARAYARSKYSWRIIAKNVIKVYERLCL